MLKKCYNPNEFYVYNKVKLVLRDSDIKMNLLLTINIKLTEKEKNFV